VTYKYAQLIEYTSGSGVTSFAVEGASAQAPHDGDTLDQLNALGQDGWELIYQTGGSVDVMRGDFRTVYWLKQAQ